MFMCKISKVASQRDGSASLSWPQKRDDPNSNPGIHIKAKDRTDSTELSSDLPVGDLAFVKPTPPHTHIINTTIIKTIKHHKIESFAIVRFLIEFYFFWN